MNPLFERLSSDFLPRFLSGVVVNFEIAGIAIALGLANAALEGLSAEHRTAITLREIDGLSYEEIASIMNCPIGTVRSRLNRARRRLRELNQASGETTREDHTVSKPANRATP